MSAIATSAPPPLCVLGIRSADGLACCSRTCGSCGGKGCSRRPGGASKCCVPLLKRRQICRSPVDVACALTPHNRTEPHWQRRCTHSAYATLLTAHQATESEQSEKRQRSTALSRSKLHRTFSLVKVLAQSIRKHETSGCKRDIVVIVGNNITLHWVMRVRLERDLGVRLVFTPWLIANVPAADKLAAWRLIEYDQIVFIDADVLIVRPLDELFTTYSLLHHQGVDFVGAHHLNDLVQGGCGIEQPRRIITALFILRPSLATFNNLLAYINANFSAYHLRHFSEQTALACFFANRSRTLSPDFLFDLSNPMARHGKHSNAWMFNCQRFGGPTMERAWPNLTARPNVTVDDCQQVQHVLRRYGVWPSVMGRVRAIHFKGAKVKPWVLLDGDGPQRTCAALKLGVLIDSPADAATTSTVTIAAAPRRINLLDDHPAWVYKRSSGAWRCVSHALRRSLRWGADARRSAKLARLGSNSSSSTGSSPSMSSAFGAAVPKDCCHARTMLASEWYRELRGEGSVSDWAASFVG